MITEEDWKKVDEYLTYLSNNPEEVKRIGDEADRLWNYLKEVERSQKNRYDPNWDRPFTI